MTPSLPSFLSRIGGSGRLRAFIRTISPGNYLLGLLACLLLGGGSYYVFAGGSTTTQTAASDFVLVESGTLVSSIKAAGKVTFSSEQQLKFNQRGTVTKVNVKVGDTVKEGQIIAEIDSASVLADIRQAQLSIAASVLQLKQMQSDNEKTLLDARNALAVSEQKLPSDLAAAERAVVEKQTALTQAELDLDKQRLTELRDLADTAQSVLSSSEKLLDSFYGVLTRNAAARPTQGNYNLEIDPLLFNDYDIKHKAEWAYLDAVNAAKAMHERYGQDLATQQDPDTVLQALTDAQQLASAIYSLGEYSYDLLQGAATGTTGFTVSDLSTLRTTVSTNRTTASGLVDQAETAKTNLTAVSSPNAGIPSVTLKAKEDAVTSARNALTLAQENLNVLRTRNPGDLESTQKSLANTETSTEIQTQLKQNDIAQKAAALAKTKQALNDYKLVAPFDGIITHIDYKVGDNLLDTGDTEFANLENPDYIVVTMPLDQVDVVHVSLGMPALVAFDAVPGRQFPGVIDQIDSTPIEQSGVVSYDVSVKFPTPQGLTILSGMTSTVVIQTAKKENVLVVPNLALKYQGSTVTVRRSTGESIAVEVGLTDGQSTEILSGLNEGDAILAINVAGQALSSSANAQQIFRGLGGLGGGGGGGVRTSGAGRPD